MIGNRFSVQDPIPKKRSHILSEEKKRDYGYRVFFDELGTVEKNVRNFLCNAFYMKWKTGSGSDSSTSC